MMQKGKFGFALWLYPYLSLWALFLNMNMVPFMIAGFVIAVEKDEWTSKQCLHTIMICVYFGMYRFVMGLFTGIPMLGLVFSVIDMIVNLVFFILVFIFGFGKLKNGKSISMFGMGMVNRAFGQMLQYVQVDARQQPTPQPAYAASAVEQSQPVASQQTYAPPPAPVMEQPVAPQPVYAPPAPAPVQPMPQPVAPPVPTPQMVSPTPAPSEPIPQSFAPTPIPTVTPPTQPIAPSAPAPISPFAAPTPMAAPEPPPVSPPMQQPKPTQTAPTQLKAPPPPPSF